MRKLLPIMLVFVSLSFAISAQENDKQEERLNNIGRFQNQKTSIKFSEGTLSGNRAIECMPEATYSNAPIDFTTWYTSNTTVGICAQKVEDFEYPVASIRFFGVQGFFQSVWNPMNDADPFDFEIKFYEDNEGTPGELITTETITLNHVYTDVILHDDDLGDYKIFHWDYTPSTPIVGLPETFWVGIANTNPDAWFLWIDQPNGLGSAAQYRVSTSSWVILDEFDDTFGICIVPALPNSQSPAAPANLVATPESMGVVGANLTWTNPTETFGGETLTELTSISLLVNDAETPVYQNNNPEIGATESFNFTATDPGLYKFSVYGTNGEGNGAKESKTVWLGNDTPAAPANVIMVANGNDAIITWNPPVTGLHNGFFDPTNTTYSILRMPDEVEVITNLTAETYTDISVPGIGNYLYIVTAQNDEGEGGNESSNVALLGLEGYLIFEGFEVNWPPMGWINDGWKDGDFGSPHSGDGWAFSNLAGTALTTLSATIPAGEVYTFSFHYLAESVNYPQGIEVMISVDGGEFENLIELPDIINTTYIQHNINLDNYAGSNIQFKFVCMVGTGGPSYGLCLDDISLHIFTPPTSTPFNQLSTVHAFPNPFGNQMSISNVDLVKRVIITNILGKQIMDVTLNGQSTISTGELGSGFYLITFEGLDGERATRKMIKR